jgi:hypothetical protein
MDYNIKFKYEGAGKNAFATRQKVLQSQRSMEQKAGAGVSQPGINRELILSIQKLISSNKSLEAAIKANRGVGGTGRGRGPGGTDLGGSAGIGGMGAALPIAGMAIAGIGFAIQKINQIGNAYIDLVSQQAGTAGVAGFQTGRRGMYLQTEQGAMVRAHRIAAGTFAGEVSNRAVQIGSIFGMGAGEIGGISGAFARSHGNFGQTVETAMGAGIETEMPMFLQNMASLLEEAVTNGVNSSDLADDLGTRLISLTRATPTNSVAMAMNIIRSQQGIQQQVAQGQIGGVDQFMMYRAAGTAINRRLSNPEQSEEYINNLLEQGVLTQEEVDAARARAAAAGRGLTLEDLEAQGTNIGPTLRRLYSAQGGADQQEAMVEEIRSNFGEGPSGLRNYMALNPSGLSPNQITALLHPDNGEIPEGAQELGAQNIGSRFQSLEQNPAFLGLNREALRQGLVMSVGAEFADTALTMERAMAGVARAIAPLVAEALPTLESAVNGLAGGLTSIINTIRSSPNITGNRILDNAINILAPISTIPIRR